MAIGNWFGSTATWGQKAVAVAAKLAATGEEIDRLNREASALALAAALGNDAAEKRLADIEIELGRLLVRAGWQREALAEAEAKAAAEQAAAEEARRRREEEAHRHRIAELRAARERAVAVAESKTTDEFVQAWAEVGRLGVELGAEIGTDHARRSLHPVALRERLTVTLWSRLRDVLHYPINMNSPEGNLSPGEKERQIVAGLLDREKKPVAVLSNDDDDEPRAAE
jgi:hypothetical protein